MQYLFIMPNAFFSFSAYRMWMSSTFVWHCKFFDVLTLWSTFCLPHTLVLPRFLDLSCASRFIKYDHNIAAECIRQWRWDCVYCLSLGLIFLICEPFKKAALVKGNTLGFRPSHRWPLIDPTLIANFWSDGTHRWLYSYRIRARLSLGAIQQDFNKRFDRRDSPHWDYRIM